VAQPRSGDIALLVDNGSLVVASNAFDLGGVGLRFEPNGQGGYDVTRSSSAGFRPDLGRRLSLGDDATAEEALAFGFSFYGASRGSVFVNSDGNLSFTRGDVAIDDRSLGRVLGGPPRAALFFADLDPTQGGGIFVSSTAAFTDVVQRADFDNTGRHRPGDRLPGGSVGMRFDAPRRCATPWWRSHRGDLGFAAARPSAESAERRRRRRSASASRANARSTWWVPRGRSTRSSATATTSSCSLPTRA
jgi:hypothetical protein